MQFPKLLIFLFVPLAARASAQDYTKYHTSITQAEEEIFLNNQPVKGLDGYAATFSKYDFVFVQDCVNAMQIALYIKDTAGFFKFATKAAQNGILIRHLDSIKYIGSNPTFQNNRERIRKIIAANRPHYLKRLDTAAIIEMYSLSAWDQMEKNPNFWKNEEMIRHSKRYTPKIKETMRRLRLLIETKGFPSDKLIGIDQNDIQRELHTGKMDYPDYYKKYKEYKNLYYIRRQDFNLDELILASSHHFPIIHHYIFMAQHSRPFDLPFLLDQIKKGLLHPKDAAAILDIPYTLEDGTKPEPAKNDPFFASWVLSINPFSTKKQRIPESYMDSWRTKLFIPTMSHDRKKYQFMKNTGMQWEWGYAGWRG